MELKGVTIKSIDKLKEFDSGFSCVNFVVTTAEEYPQTLQLQSNKDNAAKLIKYNKVGDVVDISINLRGREWVNPQGETKVFNTLEAWKVFKAKEGIENASTDTFETIPVDEVISPEDNDLPF